MTHRPRRRLLLVPLVVALCAAPAPAKEEAWDGTRPTMHEWGTLTAVQGSDGVVLDGLTHEEAGLPSFVHDLRERTRLTGVSPKMETPVIYLYAPEARRVEVDVRFPRGLITQWYPAATAANLDGLQVHGVAAGSADARQAPLKDGYIRWGTMNDLEVLAPGTTAPFPAVADDDPWRHCRATRANPLRVCSLNAGRAAGLPGPLAQKDEYERCLFYRGLGAFPLPLGVRVRTDHVDDAGVWHVDLHLLNRTPAESVRGCLAVRVEGDRAAWVRQSRVDGEAELVGTGRMEPLGEVRHALRRALLPHLIVAGLYVDEAQAMISTWEASWFGQDGTRLLYLLPEAFLERELPLTVRTRAPAARAHEDWVRRRVFLARLEVLGPEREAALVATLADLTAEDPDRRAAAEAERERWGRFATPFLARARQLAGQ